MNRKALLFLGFLAISTLALQMQSCSKSPYACFSMDTSQDSLHLNRTVTFNANCSSNGDEFFWQFYKNPDSVDFGSVVTRTLRDTGNVEVYLLVVNGSKSASTTQNIRVLP